jgi:hypothetical protein
LSFAGLVWHSELAVGQSCPPGTRRTGVETERVGKDIIYHALCEKIPETTLRPDPRELVIRPETRADCVRFAGTRLKEDLKHCSAPLTACLTDAGFTPAEAACAIAVLVTYYKPPTVRVIGQTTMIALGECGLAAIEKTHAIAECRRQWGGENCVQQQLRRHEGNVSACRQNR